MDAVLSLPRRTLLGGLAGAGGVTFAGASGAQALDPLGGAALYADVVRYAAFGDHRTATPEDQRTSEWLKGELARAGLRAKLVPWTHQQFLLRAHHLRLGTDEIACFPLWWPRSTGPQPVRGTLAELQGEGELAGRIALVAIPPVRGASVRPGDDLSRFVSAAAGRGAAGLVIVTRDPAGELVAMNAMGGLSPWPIPVMLVGGKDELRLRAGLQADDPASLLIDGRLDYAAKAYEVLGALERGPRRIVVSTPSSGWFECAGERGPGIALWLGLARWAARRRDGLSWTFVASSGHELESLGIRHFVGHDAPPAASTHTWLHLGAGIATYDYESGPGGFQKLQRANPARRLMTNMAAYEPVLSRAFAGVPGLKPIVSPEPGGEMILMARMGYPVWGFAGGSAFHHMPGDLPERITGPELLEPVARATAAALEEIANRRGSSSRSSSLAPSHPT